jgi:hypothetical protein
MRTREITRGEITVTYRVPKPKDVFKMLLKSGLDITKLDNEDYMTKNNARLMDYMMDRVDAYVIDVKRGETALNWDDFSYEPESLEFVTELITALMGSLGGADSVEKKS